ncbi:MAG: zinc ribbon domain-containing protein [Pirellulaceae bacterium]|nr:zinc ribbon domain-containing protein [Pirellulaceae bacterium]
MPIYEFYCRDCHRVFNFFARRVNTTAEPVCPQCQRPRLERKVSRFAVARGLQPKADSTGPEDDLPPGFDEAKLEQVMEELGREADGLDEDDPRQAARLMRAMYERTGMPLTGKMEEAMRRMESGEDPDAIEAEMGDLLDQDETAEGGESGGRLRGWAKKLRPPTVDETLYDLE